MSAQVDSKVVFSCLAGLAAVLFLGLLGQCAHNDQARAEADGFVLTKAQRLEVMSRITRPQLVVAEVENLYAYDRLLTRTVEEEWKGGKR